MSTPDGPGTSRALARLYDQQLRLFAAHFSNMFQGRANSASLVANYFHELVRMIGPELFVEAGAYRADASRRARAELPDCRVVAFEANPYNYRQCVEEFDFAGIGVDFQNLAVTEASGPVTFHLRIRQDGEELRRVTGNSSLLRRQDTDTEYEEITVDGVSLDDYFADSTESTACLWIDVEGASAAALRGARTLLERTAVVLIEVEEKFTWENQWRSLDVIEFFIGAGFVPLTRDAEYNQQYNIIFVRNDVYERPEVLWSHELHSNYVTQHMGVKDQDPPAEEPRGSVEADAALRPRRKFWNRADGERPH